MQPDVAEVEVADSLDLAMQSYRRYLDETPTSAMTPEAMRRLADLQLEKEFGITGGDAPSGRWIEMAAPDAGEAPSRDRRAARHRPIADAIAAAENPTRTSSAGRRARSSSSRPRRSTCRCGRGGVAQSGPLEAIAIYERLLAEYPNYERRDQVLYQMARAYDELGRTEEAMDVMQRLVGEFGYSRYSDEVQFRRGEYYFTRRKFREAEQAYETIASAGPRSDFYELALYKLGWTLYKQDFYEEALHRYMALLDYKLSVGYDFDAAHEEEDERRVADTFRVISLSFSNLGGPEVLARVLLDQRQSQLRGPHLQEPGEFYFDKLRYNDAANVYDSFVERYPYHRVSPEFGMRVIGIYEGGDFPKLVVESKKSFATKYGLQSEYWQHFDSAERPEVLGYLKTNLHDLANHYHALYQEPGLEDEKPANYAEALVWYRAFLDVVPAGRAVAGHQLPARGPAARERRLRRGGARVRAHGVRVRAARARLGGRLRRDRSRIASSSRAPARTSSRS